MELEVTLLQVMVVLVVVLVVEMNMVVQVVDLQELWVKTILL